MALALSPPLMLAVAGAACVAVVVLLLVRARRRRSAADSDSSEEESSDPISVNVVPDHEESDSLLPSFAGLLRSPWHREDPKAQRMRPVRKAARTLALGMPLPLALQRKRKPEVVLTKKVHAPYFFPLLDETAQWWQARQQDEGETDADVNTDVKSKAETKSDSDTHANVKARACPPSAAPRASPEEEPEAEAPSAPSCQQDQASPQASRLQPTGLVDTEHLPPLPAALPIDVGGG